MSQMVKTSGAADQRQSMLNRQVANCAVLFMKLHHFHWYVKGEHFFTLHAKFEELYDEMKQNMDDLAERLLALGGRPASTLQGCLQLASIAEASGEQAPKEMVQTLAGDFRKMISELQEAMEAAEQRKDETSADLFLGIKGALEKHVWMLDAFLGQS